MDACAADGVRQRRTWAGVLALDNGGAGGEVDGKPERMCATLRPSSCIRSLGLSGGSQHGVQRTGRFELHRRHHLGAGVEAYPDLRMAKSFQN